MSYALIINPYHVIKAQYGKHSGITSESYNALLARVAEIGAKDLDDALTEDKKVNIQKLKKLKTKN